MAKKLLQPLFRPRWAMATALSVVCVLGLTHIPGEEMPHALQMGGLDKLAHLGAYGLMTGLFLLSLQRPVRPALLLAGLAALILLGILDETTQPLVHRSCDLPDYVGDLAGIALAAAGFLPVLHAEQRKETNRITE